MKNLGYTMHPTRDVEVFCYCK